MKFNSFLLNLTITTFVFISLIQNTYQDLPVHCLSAQIEGDWLIHMSNNHSDKDLKCGHKNPDQNLDHYDVDVKTALKQKFEILVRLERPNKVFSLKDKSKQVGKWTMIYDEGFEFTIGDQVFFAFSKYEKVGKFTPTNSDTEDTPGYKNICDQTFIGWYHNSDTNENWGCYWAEKVGQNFISNVNLNDIDYNNIFKIKQFTPNVGGNIFRDETSSNNHFKNEHLANNIFEESFKNHQNKINDREFPTVRREPKSELKNNIKSYEKSLDKIPGMNNLVSNLINNHVENKEPEHPKEQNENSYVDFIKSIGWSGNGGGGNLNNIPHLDIYFLTEGESKGSSGFLELNLESKLFTNDKEYIKKINNPKNGYLWKAKAYDEFEGKSYAQMRNLLGNINYLKNIPDKEESGRFFDFLELEVKVRLIIINHYNI